jgi:hypothetical protein
MTRRYTVRFNYYVRAEGDRIAVYYLPAEQPDGKLAYGIYRTCWTDASGTKLLAEAAHGDRLIGIIPGKRRDLILEMADLAAPMPQAMFLMLEYRDQFRRVLTHCKDGYYGIAAGSNGTPACELEPAPAAPAWP